MAQSEGSPSRLVVGALVVLAVVAVAGIAGFAWVYTNLQTGQAAWARQQAELEAARDQLAGEREALQGELEQVKSAQAQLTVEREALQGEVETLRSDNASLVESGEALQKELDAERARADGLDAERQSLGDGEARLAGLEADIAQRERELQALGARLATAQKTVQRAMQQRQATLDEAQLLDSQMAKGKQELAQVKQQIQAQRDGLASLEESLRQAQEQMAKTLGILDQLRSRNGGS